MKKFLSICLVALCSVSAMYAQTTTPTPSTEEQDNVECGSTVTVSATSKTGFYHFKEWQIQNNGAVLETVAKNGSSTTYGASVSTAILTDGTGKDQSTLTLNPLSSALIDAATSGTVTFEAFFEIDSYTINATTEGSGKISNTGNTNDAQTSLTLTTTGQNSITLTAIPDDNCTKFDHWEDSDGNTIPGDASDRMKLTISPLPTWEHNSTHSYKAVFVPKTIKIVVTTADDQKGTVGISVTPKQ